MADRLLVSVVTPTWQRHDLLLETIENVREQTYRPLEHIIVSDGFDPTLRELIERERGFVGVPIVFQELGRNWSTFLPDSFCAAPAAVGSLLARGDYQMWLADDERMAPDHIEALVSLIEERGADFAYSRVRMYWRGQQAADGWDIGTDPPRYGQITNALYRADLLRKGLYQFGRGGSSDWATIECWLDGGAGWAMLDRVTMTHRTDH